MKAPKRRNMPRVTEKHYEAMAWCFRNGIHILEFPVDTVPQSDVTLKLRVNGRIIREGDEIIKWSEAHQRIWDYYLHIYERNVDI